MTTRKKPPFRKPLEIKDQITLNVEFSGDGEAWADYGQSFGQSNQGGFPAMLDMLQNGERVLVRTVYADLYQNGTRGLPKTGPIYELQLLEVQPVRQLIAVSASEPAQPQQLQESVTTAAQAEPSK